MCCVSGAVSYTLLYNCLDFPAGVVPVTTVTAEDEAQLQLYKGYFGDIWDKMLRKASLFPSSPPRDPFLWWREQYKQAQALSAFLNAGPLETVGGPCCAAPPPQLGHFLGLGGALP